MSTKTGPNRERILKLDMSEDQIHTPEQFLCCSVCVGWIINNCLSTICHMSLMSVVLKWLKNDGGLTIKHTKIVFPVYPFFCPDEFRANMWTRLEFHWLITPAYTVIFFKLGHTVQKHDHHACLCVSKFTDCGVNQGTCSPNTVCSCLHYFNTSECSCVSSQQGLCVRDARQKANKGFKI